MRITILTGPAASGKNTISQLLAQKRERCAVIDVDSIRQMYVQPHKAPWDGQEGKFQQQLGVKNACLLASNFAQAGIDVIILDVVVDDTAKLYNELLPEAKIVFLMPSYEEAHKRFVARPHTITEEEFKMVYTWEENLTIYDKKIDNSFLTVDEAANIILEN